jgi:hypothetical protein
MKTEIQAKLEAFAMKRSIPFCYNDYIECPAGACPKCGSDDLMRLVRGVGCEYGTDWVIRHILETELTLVDLEDAFEQSVRECYPESTKVGWMELDTIRIMKEMDPVYWRCALVDYESQEEAEGNIMSFDNGSTYYQVREIEALIETDS